MKRRILAVAIFLVCTVVISRAGGPAFIAGSGFSSGVEGHPIIWANGSIQYFTDQGNLSPILTGTQADSFVASAFSAWTSIPGVALTASQAGNLAEDVNGTNIAATLNGIITAPADITSSAVSTPVGIVYDEDGSVTDALLGVGAGGLADCFTNAVYGGPDNFSADGNIAHALVIINGICAATSAQLPDVQYRLVRVIGRILGLGWSQANVNVLTRIPVPTSADSAGFPVMHFSDPISCVPISLCYIIPAIPKMDDSNAMARLYPVSASPSPAGRIFGSVYFTDAFGNAVQPMQGVNVVARLLDITRKPSRQFVVTSVSGFAFHGNAGNIVDGYIDANGLRYDRWGSNDPALEGFFDLGELVIPAGQDIAQYQLSVEALDTTWSVGVGPYIPWQVAPSGSFAPVVVTIQNGSNVERDILMLQNEVARAHPGTGSTYANPAVLPLGGGWGSWISGYGSADWFEFTAQANRTASVAVLAMDETGAPTESKLLPTIGIWQLSDLTGNPAPASTPSAFNTATFGMSRLDAQFNATGVYRLGVADFRGDGRPDYFYKANLLYSDTVTPARLSVAGGVTGLNGTGFNPRQQVSVGGSSGAVLSASANRIEVALPAASQDGIASLQVTDPISGAFSQMIGAMTYGAAPTDLLMLLQGGNPATAVGAAAANPIRVRVAAADGVTPVGGATVAWSATNGAVFSACNGSNSCSVLSDEVGEAASLVTPTASGPSTITMALAPASYTPPQILQTTLLATSSTLDLVALTPWRWIAQGATMSTPLTVEVLNLGVPQSNVSINFSVVTGSASLSAGSGVTNGSGFANVVASVTNLQSAVQVLACIAPTAPCQTFNLFSTPASLWKLETVGGSSQFILPGQSFQPLSMRVTDGSAADNPVMGVNVAFATTLMQISPQNTGQGPQQGGETIGGSGALPVLLGASQTQVMTDMNGIASILPSAGSVGPCDVLIAVSAGAGSIQFRMESLAAIVPAIAPAQPSTPQQGKNGPVLSSEAQVVSAPNAQAASLDVELFAIPQEGPIEPVTPNPPAPGSCTVMSEGDASSIDSRDTVHTECETALDTTRPEAVRPQPAGKDDKVEASKPFADKDVPTSESPTVSDAPASSSATSSSTTSLSVTSSSTDQPNR
jgi:hypothetical protein